MTTKQFYHLSMQASRNPFLRVLRSFAFFAARPFHKAMLEMLNTDRSAVRKMEKKLTKLMDGEKSTIGRFNGRLVGFGKKITSLQADMEDFTGQHRSSYKDLEAIANRLAFMEKTLRTHESRLLEINNAIGPAGNLILDGAFHSVELPASALTIHRGRFGSFILRNPDVVGDRIRAGEFWDEHLHDLIIRHADPQGIAVDAGAYIGFHSVFMAKYFSKVVSFEPQGVVFQMLAANLLLNGIENVDLHNAALYDRECRLTIASQDKQEVPLAMKDGHPDYANISNAAAVTFEIAESDGDSVDAYPLDRLQLENVRFIKIDTQGSDLRVLFGARETILRCRPVIVFEYEIQLSKGHGSQRSDYEEFFSEIGYTLKLIRSHEDKQFDFLAIPFS